MVNTISNFVNQTFTNIQKDKSAHNGKGNLSTLKTNKTAKQAIMQQLEETANRGKNLMQRSNSATALSANSAPDSNLPRGSLVDFVV